MTITNEDGVWEVVEGIGCMNRLLLKPSEKYKAEHPEEFSEQA